MDDTDQRSAHPGRGTILRMDNVAIVVDDLAAATAFFAELGLELEGRSSRLQPIRSPSVPVTSAPATMNP